MTSPSPSLSWHLAHRRALACITALVGVVAGGAGGCDCAPPLPPPPPVEVIGTGFLIGEVFVGEQSIDGAEISVAGLAATAVSRADRHFVLYPVPVGTHTVSIYEPVEGRAARFRATITADGENVLIPKDLTTLQPPVSLTGTVAAADGGSVAGAQVFVVGGTFNEITFAGDDGSFALTNVPPGPARIAAAQDGYDVTFLDVTLVAGAQALDAPLELAPLVDAEATVPLEGNVLAAEETTDHSGTLVIVTFEGGDVVTTTDANGDFNVNVRPGQTEVRAERPGHVPVELPTVAASEGEGGVEGTVPMFIAPGAEPVGDDDDPPPPPPPPPDAPVLEIEAPLAGSSVAVGVPVPFTADIANIAADDDAVFDAIEWTVAAVGALPEERIVLGTGRIIAAVLPPALGDQPLVIEASVPGGVPRDPVNDPGGERVALVDAVAVVGAQVFAPALRLGVDSALVVTPVLAPDPVDGVLRVDIAQGHPAELVRDVDAAGAAGAVSGTVVWSEGAQPLGIDALDLSLLDVGTHLVTATVATPAAPAGTASLDLRVVVAPLVFTVAIEEPAAGTTYFSDLALPLTGSFVHPFQIGFPPAAVRWLDVNGQVQVGGGIVTSTRAAPTTQAVANRIALEITDVAGNVRIVDAPYSYVPLAFTASFNQPGADGIVVQEDDDVTFNVGYAHPSLQPADVRVTLTSNVDGTLADADSGAIEFAPFSDVRVTTLSPGPHSITARAFGGGRVAVAVRTLTVEAPFVTATLQSPPTMLALDGAAMRFEVLVGATPGLAPRVTWLVDGQPFLAEWDVDGSYDAGDAQFAGNRVVDFGAFDSSPLTEPFATHGAPGGLWDPGTHTVQAWVRLPGADGNGIPAIESAGCTNLGSQSHCINVSLTVFEDLQVKGESGDVTLTAAEPAERWSGGILLKARYIIDGGTLIIDPGTVVVVDMGTRANPAVPETQSTSRSIIVNDGTLQVGAPGAPPVRFETRKSFPVTLDWQGIRNGTQSAGVPRVISLENVIIGDAVVGFDAVPTNGTSILAANNSVSVRDVTVERSGTGMSVPCPEGFTGLTFRDNTLIGLAAPNDVLCPPAWSFDGAVFENTGQAIQISDGTPRAVSLTNLAIDSRSTQALVDLGNAGTFFIGGSVISGNDLGIGLRYAGAASGGLRVEDTDIVDNFIGVQIVSFNARHELIGNRFARNEQAINLFGSIGDVNEFHLNSFVANDAEVNLVSGAIADVAAEGNFFGDPGDTGTTAGRMAIANAGTIPDLTRVLDGIDSANLSRVHTDNFLQDDPATAPLPLAYIRAPAHMASYHPALCIPLVAEAPLSTSTIDPLVDCTWRLFTLGTDPQAPGSTPLTPGPGEDRCAQEPIADGVHGLALICTDADNGAVTTHTTRLRVSGAAYSGHVTAPGIALGGDVLIDGDLIVDEGATLTLLPGAVVSFSIDDRRRFHQPRPIAGGRIGDSDNSELVVRGVLHVAGTAAAPVRLQSAAGGGVSLWGGIVAETGSVVLVEHADVEGAVVFVDGEQAADPLDAPSITIRDSAFDSIGGLGRGTCPSSVVDTTATFVNGAVLSCLAPGDVTIARAAFDDVRAGGAVAALTAYPGTTPGVVVADSSFSGTVNSAFVVALAGNIPLALIDNVAAAGFGGGLVSANSAVQISIFDSTVEGWTGAVVSLNQSTGSIVQIERSTFRQGTSIISGVLGSFTMRDSLVEDVSLAFASVQPFHAIAVAINGNEIRRAGTVLSVNGLAQTGITSWNLTGNNFIDTSDFVIELNGNTSAMITRIDLDGSFFGAGVDSNGEIEALIDDPRTDASGGDTVDGNTDYTGFVTSPLVLDLPTP